MSKNILFLGTHGQYNIGDELLLETFLAQLGDTHRYSINSYDPAFTTEGLADRYDVDVFSTSGSRLELLRRIGRSDLLFFGGGSIIKELYASVGRNRYATLMMVLAIVTYAKRVARKPIIMSNIGVGPIATQRGRELAHLILSQVDLVAVRDRKSYDTCLELGINGDRLIQTPDAVFVNDPGFFGLDQEIAKGCRDKVRVALNLNYNIENPANWDHFLDNLEAGLRDISLKLPIEVHTLPMQSRFNPDNDLKVLTAFRERLPEIDFILHEPITPNEVARIIAGCDLVIAERLHSLVIAAILHKPFVALTYDVKVRQLAEFLEMSEFAIDINRPFEHQTLRDNVLAVYEQRESLALRLGGRAAEAGHALQAYFGRIENLIAAW